MTEQQTPATTGTDPVQPTTGVTPEKTFTQDEVNALMARVRDEGRQAAIKGLGFDKADDAKAAINAYKAAQEAQMSELEKAQTKAAEADARAQTAAQEAQTVIERAKRMALKSAVLAEAIKPDYKLRPEAMRDLWVLIEADYLDKVTADDDGEVKGADKAIKAALEGRSYLTVEQTPGIGTPRPDTKRRPPTTEEQSVRPSFRF